MSPTGDDAIVAALGERTVDSTSILATGPSFGSAMSRLPPGVDLGVHLDLTGFPSLTGAPALARLREAPPGELPERLAGLARRHPELILAEWHAQVAAVRRHRRPSHLDSHHHTHWNAALWPLLRALLRETGIRAVRGVGGWRPEASGPRRVAQALRASRFRRGFSDFVTTAAFANATTFRSQLDAGLDVVSIEVMAHPGNPAHERYAEEMAWLAGSWDGHRDRIVRCTWAGIGA